MKILVLCDYLGRFGSKRFSIPYMGGFDLVHFERIALNHNVRIEYASFSSVLEKDLSVYEQIIYTSSEDKSLTYKAWIEDVVCHLEHLGLPIYPKYEVLRSHHNKVFMELTGKRKLGKLSVSLAFKGFSVCSELKGKIDFPKVLKTASGAKSSGVRIVKSQKELERATRQRPFSSIALMMANLKELGRQIKHHGYVREKVLFDKYILQDLVPNLNHDYKVLVYGHRVYVMKRFVRPDDFRASGSGNFVFLSEVNDSLLDLALSICKELGLKMVALDIVVENDKYYLIEWQGLFYGTTTAENAVVHWKKENEKWIALSDKLSIEELYIESLCA